MDNVTGLAVGPCTCRVVFKNYDNAVNTAIMLELTRSVFAAQITHDYLKITNRKAKAI